MIPTTTATTRVALVTGANKGIGFEVARQLALLSPDFHVILGSRDPDLGSEAALSIQKEATEPQFASVTPISMDVQSDASISSAAERIKEDFGRVDILINNAGIAAEGRRPGASLREQYAETFDVNVFGVAAVTEAFIPLLSQSAAPRLVFVSSRLGSLSFIADPHDVDSGVEVPAYRSSKTALNMLTAYYAKKFAERGWKVNACCPGFTATSLNNFRGFQTVQEAAVNIVRLSTIDAKGPTGTFSNKDGELPW